MLGYTAATGEGSLKNIAGEIRLLAGKGLCILCLGGLPLWAARADTLPDTPGTLPIPDTPLTPGMAQQPLSVTAPASVAAYGQYTNVYQWHPAFTSPYQGANSLSSNNNGDQTNDATLYAGWRPSNGS